MDRRLRPLGGQFHETAAAAAGKDIGHRMAHMGGPGEELCGCHRSNPIRAGVSWRRAGSADHEQQLLVWVVNPQWSRAVAFFATASRGVVITVGNHTKTGPIAGVFAALLPYAGKDPRIT